MRTRREEQAVFTWLSPAAIATELGVAEDTVREHIRNGDFPDVNGEPGAIDLNRGRENSKPRYRVHPESLRAFKRACRINAA